VEGVTAEAPLLDPLAIALKARLYKLVADRPEFLGTDAAARLDAAWTDSAPGSLALIDRINVAAMTEVDRLCGYAVAKLRSAASRPVLDVLGMLNPDRLVAMYYALPEAKRSSLLRDGAWAFYVNRADPDAVQAAEAFWNDMPALRVSTDLSPAAQAAMHRFQREAERLRAGLPHDLDPRERRCVVANYRHTEQKDEE
jgi:hypothetical protein